MYLFGILIIRKKMNKLFYGVASMPKSERRRHFLYSADIVVNDNFPGPGSYELSKQKHKSQLPKWRYFENHSVSRKN